MTATAGQIIRLDTVGRCSHCSGIVTNTDARKGCSLSRLVEIHETDCPGVPARRRKDDDQ